MSEKAKERGEPPRPEPVIIGNVRYEALLWGKARDLGQNGGYIEAFDNDTGESLWVLKVYDVDYSRDMEDDKLDVFIESITVEETYVLQILNERGRTFRLDLRDQSVCEILH